MNISKTGSRCSGCGSCQLACPFGAVIMAYDENGFLYPKINECKCTGCGICVKICPQEGEWKRTGQPHAARAYIAVTKDDRLGKKSASGGIAANAALWFLGKYKNSYVCGAAFDGGIVRHVLISKPDELHRIQGSRYVQSELGDIFIQIRVLLEQGASVLFTGTPCQCHALHKYIGKDNAGRLVMIDIICHGVPGMKHLQKDLDGYFPAACIADISFRQKQKYFRSKSIFALKMTLVNGKEKMVLSSRDPFFHLFLQGKNYRKGCYQCQYACMDRAGDITLGDSYSHREYPGFHPHEAVSAVILNSAKGWELWQDMKDGFDFAVMDLEREAAVNRQLLHPVLQPDDWEQVMADFRSLSIEELRKRYAMKKNLKYYAAAVLWKTVPGFIMQSLAGIIRHR